MPDLPPPTPEHMDAARRLLEPWTLLVSPVFHGMETLPRSGPMLFVGNHTLVGVLDAPFMVLGLYEQRGLMLRALGDHIHFQIPGWRKMLAQFGAVDGTRENCSVLMDRGEAILVFPGGAREVTKRKGEEYKLIWKERRGFARMAIQHGCQVVPFSALGVEDALDIVYDANDLLESPLGKAIAQLGVRQDLLPPVVKGIGPTPIPRPERLYFRFAPPIDAASYGADPADDEAVDQLRDRIATEIEHGLGWLRTEREADPYRKVVPRVLSEVGRRLANRLLGDGD